MISPGNWCINVFVEINCDGYESTQTVSLRPQDLEIRQNGYESTQTTSLRPQDLEIRWENSKSNPEDFYANGIIILPDKIKLYEEVLVGHDDGTGIIEYYTEITSEELTAKDISKLHSLSTDLIGRPGEGENAEVFNGSSKALGARSHAEGASTIAYGNFSHTEGQQTITGEADVDSSVGGLAAHAEGMFTQASGSRAHSEGNRTIAYGVDSHAEGIKTAALGKYAHVEGQSSNPPLGSPRAADNA